MDDQRIHRLFQLKSYEQPSPEKIEEFILEFHRRQDALSSSISLLEQFKERIVFFFSELQVPKMAYVGATAIALFCSILILRTNIGSQEHSDPTSSSLSAENFSAIHYYSSPIIENDVEPVSFNLKKVDSDNDSIFSSMSHILKKKSSAKEFPMSF